MLYGDHQSFRNLPFVTTEDDLRFLFKKYGELTDVQVIFAYTFINFIFYLFYTLDYFQVIIDKKSGKCKGFAIVEFIFPENGVAAYSELDGTIFKVWDK